jgi:hypothetical protein
MNLKLVEKILNLTGRLRIVGVGESSEEVGPPRVSVTSVSKTQILTKTVEGVGDPNLQVQRRRHGVIVTVSVGRLNSLTVGIDGTHNKVLFL